MSNIKYWYVGGDLHGECRNLKYWVEMELPTPKDESAVIILGDAGLNYYGGYKDRHFKSNLNSIGIMVYCLRGNHEMRISDAIYYGNYGLEYDENVGGKTWFETGYPNIRYFLDEGGLYHINGKEALIVPGAYSVDKDYRLERGWNWFPNEQLDENEREVLKIFAHDMDFDYIFAHTCPHSWEPYIDDLFMDYIDQSEVDKTTEDFLDELLNDCSYKYFYFGHYHNDREIPNKNATMLFKFIIPLGNHLIAKERN